jgi:hypothetical protein
MNPRDFLLVAEDLLEGTREADWRSAVSRAYYAAFLVAAELFRDAGFRVPPDGNGHAYVYLRLNNCGREEVIDTGAALWDLRGTRNWADYDMATPLALEVGVRAVADARRLVRFLDDLADSEAVLGPVVAAMRVYERDVLKQVTFREP